MRTQGDITSTTCNNCGDDVDHHVAGVCMRTENWGDPSGDGPEYSFRYELLQCIACKRATLRETSWFSEDTSSEDGRPTPSVKYSPPRMRRRLPPWLSEAKDNGVFSEDPHLPFLIEHIYSAIDNGCLELATMGIRTMIDAALQSRIGRTKANFRAKLAEAVTAKLISESQSEILRQVLDFGSETSHQILVPPESEVFMALDVAESLVQFIYINPSHAAELRRRMEHRRLGS